MTNSETWALGLAGIVLLLALLFIPFLPGKAVAQLPSVTLDWTAPGDDGAIGTASTYQMRWSTVRPDTTSTAAMDAWWAAATSVPGLPAPAVSGTRQSVTVAGPFPAGQTYYFVMKACDEVPNCSAYSNVAAKPVADTTPPSRILDLIVR